MTAILGGILMLSITSAISIGYTYNGSYSSTSANQTLNPWTGFRYDTLRNGSTASPAPSQDIGYWNATFGDTVWSSPAVADGMVFVGSDDHSVHALNATNGMQIWNYTTGNLVRSSPWVYGDKVYVGSDDSYLYCLNKTNGALIWKWLTVLGSHYAETDHLPLRSSPLVVSGRVYVTYMTGAWFTGDHFVYYAILNATTGGVIGIWYGGDGMLETYSSPALLGNNLYVALGNRMWCQDSASMQSNWAYPTSGPLSATIESTPAVGYGKVFFGCNDHKLYALDRILGTLVWNFTTDGAVFTSPALSDNHVYFGSTDGQFYCLNQADGKLLWNRTLTYPIYSSPAVAGGKVYFGSTDGTFYTLNATTGATLWTHSDLAGIKSSPAVADGIVYYGCEDKALHAIGSSRAPTSITVQLSPDSIVAGDNVTLSGKLSNATSDAGIPSASIDVSYSTDNNVTWHHATTLSTNSSGWYKVTGPVGSPGTYRVKVQYAGSAVYQPCSAISQQLNVLPQVSKTYLFFNSTPNPTPPAQMVTLRGILVYVDAGNNIGPVKNAVLNISYSVDYGVTWNPAGNVTTSSNGLFQKTFTAPAIGVYLYRLVYGGSQIYAPVTSTEFLVVR
jgi:outer membrane protein assembly factor BamB